MGDILGIGCTHGPSLQFRDEEMANVLRRILRSDRTPTELRDPHNWPAEMREEWGTDDGMAAAARHRATLVEGFRAARAAVDAFKPDFVLIFGDDQYENFKLDIIPPFCVYALNEMPSEPFKGSAGLGASDNVWNEPNDRVETLRGHPEAAGAIAQQLVEEGFDVGCAYRFNHAESLNHAFTRTVLYLDYDRRGFDYPIIPFHVNCYGVNLRVPEGDRPAQSGKFVPPPSPPAWRCYDLGKALARVVEASPWRAVIIGSSSWSHASLTRKHHYVYPDVTADRQRLSELKNGRMTSWRDFSSQQIVDSGQHEILNWVCLAGAMEGRYPDVLAYAETYLFNSSKAVVLFPREGEKAA